MIEAGLGVRAFFTSRHGGVSAAPYESLNVADHVGDDPSAVAANREVVAGMAGARLSVLTAEHGSRVAEVTAPGQAPPPADALVTTTPGVALVAIAADCVPVLMHDRASGAVAAVHVGREGLYAGVLDAAVAAILDKRGGWKAAGAMDASIGPAICGRCYEVPAAMRDAVGARHPIAVATTSWGTPSLDLPRAVESRLGQLGFDQIVHHRACTLEDPGLFSHRRDGITGRIAGVIVCEGTPGVSLP